MNILNFFFPKRCLGCGRIGKYFCENCKSSIKTIAHNEAICPMCEKPAIDGATHPRCQTRYSLDGLTSFYRYNGIIRAAVKMLKYRLVTDLAKEFIGLIPSESLNQIALVCHSHPSERLGINSSGNPVFIPIPLHASRYRDRGFNQAEVLGKTLAKRFGIALCSTILFRTRATTPQVEMKDREKRLKNMEKVFSVTQATKIQYTNNTVILFDDVFTTGATMRAAANVLKRAGFTFVWAVTMAK